jgi:hypothetical protein
MAEPTTDLAGLSEDDFLMDLSTAACILAEGPVVSLKISAYAPALHAEYQRRLALDPSLEDRAIGAVVGVQLLKGRSAVDVVRQISGIGGFARGDISRL